MELTGISLLNLVATHFSTQLQLTSFVTPMSMTQSSIVLDGIILLSSLSAATVPSADTTPSTSSY